MRKFYQCVIGDTNVFGRQCETMEEAQEEAEVLAGMYKFRDKKVYVLESVASCQLDGVKWD